MRPYFCTRFHRRFIVKYFGGTKNLLLWGLGVTLTVYILDNYFFGYNQFQLTPDGVQKMTNDARKESEKSGDAESQQLVKLGCSEQTETCPEGQYSYYIKAGAGKDGLPIVCFNGRYAFSPEKKHGSRGINIAVYNPKTLELDDARIFDTYQEDTVLFRYMKLGLVENQIMLLATADEASSHLSLDTIEYFKDFGSERVTRLGFRDSWVMIGQRGLAPSKAVETIATRDKGSEYPPAAEVKGCVTVPLGELKEISKEKYNRNMSSLSASSSLRVGEALANCGMKEACPDDKFSVRLYTGTENKEGPSICVNGRYVMTAGLNNGGRGLNVVVVDPSRKVAVDAIRYDTYEVVDDNAALVAQLKILPANQLVLIVAHDDAQTSLSEDVRRALEKCGSSYISALQFRDVWTFVGRPNLKGYSMFEDIELGGRDSWPVPIDMKICVPIDFKGSETKPNLDSVKNMPKRAFCRKYDGYEEFCSAKHMDEHPKPIPLDDPALKYHPVFKTPIILVPGLSHIATIQQFQALMAIPGIDQKMVAVLYDQKFEESGLLAKLYDFPTFPLNSSTKYIFLFEKALEEIWKLHPSAESVIVLEEEVLPATDFLHFLSQCWTSFQNDPTLIGISGWNENGFENASTMADLAYRGEMGPGLGFVLKKSFYVDSMRGEMKKCCSKRSWYGWFAHLLKGKEMIFPDVSRVRRRQFLGLTENAELVKQYFNRPRGASAGQPIVIKNAQSLVLADYEAEVSRLLSSSVPLATDNAQDCLNQKGLGFYIPDTKDKVYSIYFDQQNVGDDSVLSLLCKCFRLFYATGHSIRGKHKETMRFSYRGNQIFLVGSSSPYNKHKPSDYKPVTK